MTPTRLHILFTYRTSMTRQKRQSIVFVSEIYHYLVLVLGFHIEWLFNCDNHTPVLTCLPTDSHDQAGKSVDPEILDTEPSCRHEK